MSMYEQAMEELENEREIRGNSARIEIYMGNTCTRMGIEERAEE